MKARLVALWREFTSLAAYQPTLSLTIEPPKARPLFRPTFEWWPGTSPQMSENDFARRKACRELDQAFEIRARDVRNHH